MTLHGELRATPDSVPPSCEHLTRTRDNLSGFASAETVCAGCGQGFDAEREQELRARDHPLNPEASRPGMREGYVVG